MERLRADYGILDGQMAIDIAKQFAVTFMQENIPGIGNNKISKQICNSVRHSICLFCIHSPRLGELSSFRMVLLDIYRSFLLISLKVF